MDAELYCRFGCSSCGHFLIILHCRTFSMNIRNNHLFTCLGMKHVDGQKCMFACCLLLFKSIFLCMTKVCYGIYDSQQ